MDAFTKSFLLLVVLLNPFTMSVYLMELMRSFELRHLAGQLVRGGLISLVVFVVFAGAGDRVFQDVLQVRFSAFLIFGGITFLIIGIRLMMGAGPVVDALQPRAGQISAAIAMPLMVGPGTISASVLAGSRLSFPRAALAIALALTCSLGAVLAIKVLYDLARARDSRLVQAYSEIAGRATALFTGSFAVEMILSGLERWLSALPSAG